MQDHEENPRSVRVDGIAGLAATPERVELRRLAAAMRAITTRLVSTTAEPDELADAATQLEAIAESLSQLPVGHTYEGFSEAANAGAAMRAMAQMRDEDDPERFGFFDHSPLIGLSNPLSPPMIMDHDPADSTMLRASVNFGPAYEGPPGCVHGGYVAAIFDELLGATQSLSGIQGMTAHLEIDYRSPTPLGEDLRLRGWLDGTEGRKIWARATLHAGDRLCAEAMALFLAFRPGTFEEMLQARDG
ncbi:MAG: PaaI family thioesterase [Actinomycetia bacterium]|nr:PaaI family thioesterase [Actinomycetes bacterium]